MKTAIYCRLSEEDRNKTNRNDDSISIQNQKSMLIQYAIDQGWEIYDIYSDDDYTGSDRNRPQFKRLLIDAQAQKFNIVLCKTQSRFTRELELVEKYIHGLFPVWGIRFVSIVDNADTENKGNKKSRQIIKVCRNFHFVSYKQGRLRQYTYIIGVYNAKLAYGQGISTSSDLYRISRSVILLNKPILISRIPHICRRFLKRIAAELREKLSYPP